MQDFLLEKTIEGHRDTVPQGKPSQGHHVRHFLKSYCEDAENINEGIIVLNKGDTIRSIAQWPEDLTVSTALSNTINMAIKRQSSVKIIPAIGSDSHQASILATPIITNEKTDGVIAIVMNTSNSKETTKRLIELEEKAKVIASELLKQHTTSRPADASKLMLLQQAFLAEDSLNDACIAVVNELANLLKFDRVCIGLYDKNQIQMTAISNLPDFIKEHEVSKAIAVAMEEATDQIDSIMFPAPNNGRPYIHLAHKALYEKTNDAACTVPLIHKKKIVGALTLAHHDSASISTESMVWFEQIANFLAPLIAVKQEAEASWIARAKTRLQQLWHRVLYREDGKSSIVVPIAAILLAICFIPVDYHIGAHAHIEGQTQRIMAAPVEGYIKNTYVRPGDAVTKGMVLIDLAEQDLLLEKQKWQAEITQQENNVSSALAQQNRTEYAISQAKASQARSELALIEQELARTHIKSPIDGIVLEGDLSQSLGAPVNLGDRLMTIAPKDAFRIMIDIDERDIQSIYIGQQGTLALSALPTDKVKFTVQRITPVATVKNGVNTYEVEANLLNQNQYLRPGLLGIAKIDAGKHTLLWSTAHRVIDWLKLSIWKWRV